MSERRESDSWMENDLSVDADATESKTLSVPGGDTNTVVTVSQNEAARVMNTGNGYVALCGSAAAGQEV